MSDVSCKDRCPYARYCYAKGSNRADYPDECGSYYHIEDIIADARDEREEQLRSYAKEYDIPYEEVHDWI